MMTFIMKSKTMLGDFGINVLLSHYSDLMLGTAPDKSCTIFIAKNYVVMVKIILKMLVYFFWGFVKIEENKCQGNEK
ncbi:hypothetical protein G3257_03910 [Janthinobacterium lividum]|uniref:hypothetical protein n=1 Tax=Janthinobacterium lividum TaxID=29581 RepID=UPI00159620B1|nr:hypothetical protein [Janthinobacterium lividum]QKY01493.1 hypothetical protein G3257_03910 [Janthinobacterium lividum]